MDKWWQNSYINRRNWILENVRSLSVSPRETLLILMIDYFNEFQKEITPLGLAEYCGLSELEIDEIVSSLSSKEYLQLIVSKSGIVFSIAGVFEFAAEKEESIEIKELFSLFEEEFGRTLSQQEFVYLNNWQSMYSRKQIIEALREALVAQKFSFAYIDRILIRIKRDENED